MTAPKYEVLARAMGPSAGAYPNVAVCWPNGLTEFMPAALFIKMVARRGASVK